MARQAPQGQHPDSSGFGIQENRVQRKAAQGQAGGIGSLLQPVQQRNQGFQHCFRLHILAALTLQAFPQ